MLRRSVSCKNRQQPITQNVHHAPPQPSNHWVAGADSPWTGFAAYRVKGSYLRLAAVGAHCYFFSNKVTFINQSWHSRRPRRAQSKGVCAFAVTTSKAICPELSQFHPSHWWSYKVVFLYSNTGGPAQQHTLLFTFNFVLFCPIN